MLTIRDHHTGALFDPRDHLGPKRRSLLERSWAGVFREYLLRQLPVDELTPHFCDGFGRPSKDLYVVLGALLLQQLHDLTDKQTVEAVAFNLAWHYALDIGHEDDAYLCERTLRNYRHLVIEHELDQVLFRRLTDQLISSVGVDTRRQRLDSTAIRSYMRSLTRLGILVEATSKFLRELRRTYPALQQQIDPELWRKYVGRAGEGCFASATPSQSKRRLPEAAADLEALLAQFSLTAAAELESYRLLERVFEEQCERVEEASGQSRLEIRDPDEISCDNVLNPADPDASYNKHRGVGYLVQVMETFSQESAQGPQADGAAPVVARPDLITHVGVGKMNVHDSRALVPALEDTAARGVAPEQMVADTHYGSVECLAEAKASGVELIAPAMPPKGKGQGKLTLEDFELDEAGCILRCPQGQMPLETSASKQRLQARFDQGVCSQCPLREICLIAGKDRLQYTHERVKQRARRLAEQSSAFRDRYRWRAGIEGTMSRLKYQMGLARLQVRGQTAIQYRVFLRALGLNIHRVAAWKQALYLAQRLRQVFWRLASLLKRSLEGRHLYKHLIEERVAGDQGRLSSALANDFLPARQHLTISLTMKQVRSTISILCAAVVLGACGDEPASTDMRAMREAITESLARFDAACIHPPLAARGEVFPATIEAAAKGGEWLKKMESLEAVGFFTGEPVQVQGRPARVFRLTERGRGVYRQETSGLGLHTHLLCYGAPEVVDILEYTDPVVMPAGGTMTQVKFTYAVHDAAAWARDPAVREAFPEIDQDLASSQTPQEGQVVLVKTGDGWVDQRLMQQSP